jgi:hypothetical protein
LNFRPYSDSREEFVKKCAKSVIWFFARSRRVIFYPVLLCVENLLRKPNNNENATERDHYWDISDPLLCRNL